MLNSTGSPIKKEGSRDTDTIQRLLNIGKVDFFLSWELQKALAENSDLVESLMRKGEMRDNFTTNQNQHQAWKSLETGC